MSALPQPLPLVKFLNCPPDTAIIYVHDSETKKSAVCLNEACEMSEAQHSEALAVARQFHLEVMAEEIIPEDGEFLIWTFWTLEDLAVERLLAGIEALDALEREE